MNKCDKSENQLFDSMVRFIKNGVLLVRDPHLAAKVAIIPKKWKFFLVLKVNTQFRAYPFYKASEWMPHKKLLLNSIVF